MYIAWRILLCERGYKEVREEVGYRHAPASKNFKPLWFTPSSPLNQTLLVHIHNDDIDSSSAEFLELCLRIDVFLPPSPLNNKNSWSNDLNVNEAVSMEGEPGNN